MPDQKIHDVRLVRHHIRRQTLDPKDHQAYLDGLEDCADMCVPTETRFMDAPPPVEEASEE